MKHLTNAKHVLENIYILNIKNFLNDNTIKARFLQKLS